MSAFLKKVILYLLAFFLLLNLTGLLFDFILRNSEIFKANILFKKDLPDNLILGSSRALTGIDSKLLSEKTSEIWYNLSVDDTPIETHLLIYELLLQENKIPKRLLLQYENGRAEADSNTIFDRDYQFLPFSYHDGYVIWNYIKNRDGCLGASYYLIPFFKYTTYNTELVISVFRVLLNKKSHHRFDKYGDYSYPKKKGFKSVCPGKKKKSIDFNNPALTRLEELCSRNGTQLIVFTAPYTCLKSETKGRTPENYIDYSDIFHADSLFYDNQHLNVDGKKMLTLIISDDIKSL